MLTEAEQKTLSRRGYVKYKGEIFPVVDIKDLRVGPGDPVPHVFIDVQTGIRINDPDLTLPTVDEVLEYKRKQSN